MAVVLVSKDDVMRLICEYSLQSGRSFEENILFIMS